MTARSAASEAPAMVPTALDYPRVMRTPVFVGEGVFERAERRLGRSDWTVADYRRAGEEAFPSLGLHPSLRADAVKAFVKLNCPPAKLAAHVAGCGRMAA